MFEEEASLEGDSSVVNETNGKVDLQVGLNNNTVKYTGDTSAQLLIRNIAELGNMSEFCNIGNNGITFYGKMYDGAKISFEGHKGGVFSIQNGVNIEGNCTLVNEGSGNFYMKNVNMPDGVVLKNIASKGRFNLMTSGGGVVDIEPGTEFIVVNNGNFTNGLENWGDLKLSSGTLNIKDGSVILNGGFGGNLTVDATGNWLYHHVSNFTWNGQEIRTRINNVGSGSQPERHVHLCTSNLDSYTNVESTVNVYLYGTFLDGTDIKIKGESNNGTVYFYDSGTFGGLIDINYTGGAGSGIRFYNDINGLENFTFNSVGSGFCIVQSDVLLGSNIMINNDSVKSIFINSGVSIGDNVTIDVSSENNSNIYISENVPAGTYLSY